MPVAALKQEIDYLNVCQRALPQWGVFNPRGIGPVCAAFQAGVLAKTSVSTACADMRPWAKDATRFDRACPELFMFKKGVEGCARVKTKNERRVCEHLAKLSKAIGPPQDAAACRGSDFCLALLSRDMKRCSKLQDEAVAAYCADKAAAEAQYYEKENPE